MKRAVITGPTGAIGTALIAELISHGIEVEAVVRPGSRRTDNIPKSPLVHIVPCDLKELKTLHEKIEHADVFYHFGWDGTFGNSRNNAYGQLENVRYALDAVEAAAALAVRHLSAPAHRQNTDGWKAAKCVYTGISRKRLRDCKALYRSDDKNPL